MLSVGPSAGTGPLVLGALLVDFVEMFYKSFVWNIVANVNIVLDSLHNNLLIKKRSVFTKGPFLRMRLMMTIKSFGALLIDFI